ncbi:alpha/beta fold hydrolase [Cohnella phaseoli]|uniref:Pimeloyl-ACP methyl ester carboxylesterase n=1 Tax=Cohnella phaseoli TaxID=456490 RepID=A0A3D9KS46_9BACL|nr:alpha/beta hydrolase [Cohnella phaseoli]RED89224.1 pimeloyl-ACP methyl ester carboxylesterase [Cohnella phaseoli]
MPQIMRRNCSIYYESRGNGLPLIFIPGPSFSHRLFEPQIEYFRHYYRVVAMDLRGNGQSGKLGVSGKEIIEEQCRDISALLNHLGITNAVFIGFSGGGFVVQKFAHLYPDKVRAVVAADSHHWSITQNRIVRFFQSLAALSHFIPEDMGTRTIRIIYSQWLLAYKILKKEGLQKRPTETIKQEYALHRLNYREFAPFLQIPVLLVASEGNAYLVTEAQEMRRLLPCSKVEIINDSLDPSHLCQPLKFNAVVRDFLVCHGYH